MGGHAQAAPPGDGATNVRDYGALGDGIADDTAAIQAALVACRASAQRYLYIPAGTYKWALTAGDLFALNVPGLTVAGDGVGRSVLLDADGVVLTGRIRRFAISAEQCTVRDLSIVGSASMSGPADTSGVSALTGGLSYNVSRVLCSGLYGYGAAGGVGFDCYQDPLIGGGWQWGTMEDCTSIDMPLSTGFGTASSGNAFIRCRAIRCGNNTTRHAFYAQGGNNYFEQCYAESASGFSFHAHKQSSSLDASGDIYDGCVSINPGLKHMIVDSTGNPPLTRYVTIRNCLFKGSAEGIDMRVPAIVEGNTFENVRATGQNSIVIGVGGDGSIVRGNMLKNSAGIFLGAPSTAEGNSINSVYGVGTINCAVNDTVARGNRIVIAGVVGVQGATGIIANVSNAIVEGNLITITAPGTCMVPGSTALLRNNILEPRGGAWTYTIGGGNFAGPLGSDVVR